MEPGGTMKDDIQRRIQGLASLIGNTPLMKIDYRYRGEDRTIYAKAENFNMTGSIKDRMAFHVIQKAYASGALKPGDRIAEATSGNTGIAFSAIGRALGHPVTIFMPNWMSSERIKLIQSLGAEIVLISKEEGGFLGSIDRAEQLAKTTEGVFLPRQFSNEDNAEAHYLTTGAEIWWQLQHRSVVPDAFVAGVGTGGTVMGVGRALKARHPNVKVYPLEPSNSPTLSTGHKVGHHRIQGISDEFIPAIVDLNALDEVIGVDDGDSILMAQKFATSLGLGIGISSGANFLGALKIQNDLGGKANVVTIFSDDNKKYLSTDLVRDEPTQADQLTPDVELLGVHSFKRVCNTCCDPEECTQIVNEEDGSLVACPLKANILSS